MERQTTRIAIAQINPTINDFDGNLAKIIDAMVQAKSEGADLVVTPELATIGYPAEDLLARKLTLEKNNESVEQIQAKAKELGISVLLGCLQESDSEGKKPIHNSAVFIGPDGEVLQTRHKTLLPTYDIFHEDRYFAEGLEENIVATTLNGVPCGVTVCEEIWADRSFWKETEYEIDPVEILAEQGVKFIINTSASPYSLGKPGVRDEMLHASAARHGITIIYANQVGGNTELIFDGNSQIVCPERGTVVRGNSWEEDMVYVDLDENGRVIETEAVVTPFEVEASQWAPEYVGEMEGLEEMAAEAREALVLGIRDYCRKCGFDKAVIGLSGGIDSAVTAALAVEALGAENVRGIGMPSSFSSEGSVIDARILTENLGIAFEVKAIEGVVNAFRDLIGNIADVADENLQARARGTILMGISNRENRILLTTGNKSELAVGYCTLYGDMNGGLAVISDCPKELVYALAREINRDEEVIPDNSITKVASAELRPDQQDSDSLPPYPVLDRIVHEWVVNESSFEEIKTLGLELSDEELLRILKMIDRTEYKRRQAVPGLRVTGKSFGRHDRWLPIASKTMVA